MTDWIDRLEQRVGLRPAEPTPITPADAAAVVEISKGAVEIVGLLHSTFPDAFVDAPELAAAAQAVLDGHQAIVDSIAAAIEQNGDRP